jgi:hypothetical protein
VACPVSHRQGAARGQDAGARRERGPVLNALGALLEPLGLTLAVELPAAALLGLRTRRALLVVALVNLITNPLLTYVLLVAGHLAGWGGHTTPGYVALLVAGEIVVVVAEWWLLLWTLGGSTSRMLRVSVAINAASALAALVVWWL